SSSEGLRRSDSIRSLLLCNPGAEPEIAGADGSRAPLFPEGRDHATLPRADRGQGGRGRSGRGSRPTDGREGPMRTRGLMPKAVILGIILGLGRMPPRAVAEGAGEPIVYTVRFLAPEKHVAEVEATLSTGSRPSFELMMPVWSPGFYRVEDYAGKVEGLTART